MPATRRRAVGRALALAVLAVLVAAVAVLVPRLTGAAAAGPGTAGTLRPAVPVAADAPLVAFVGDSWTFGTGATDRHGYAYLTAEQLGWRARVLGVGGSGYSVPGPHHNVFSERIAAAVAGDPDVIVVQGSLNERRSTPQALARSATATLADLRASAGPATRILVLGAAYNPGTPDATIDWINTAVAGAADAAGLPFVNPAAEAWTDPADPWMWSDSIHPDDLGHQILADHLRPVLAALLAA